MHMYRPSPATAVVHLVGTSSKRAQTDPNQRLKHETVRPHDTPADHAPVTESVAQCLLSPSQSRHTVVAPAHTSLFVVRTPKANASLVSLKDYEVRGAWCGVCCVVLFIIVFVLCAGAGAGIVLRCALPCCTMLYCTV